jgi:hypothetical protein
LFVSDPSSKAPDILGNKILKNQKVSLNI